MRVVDTHGNPVSGATVVFTVTSGGGVVSGASQLTNSEGIAQPGAWALGTAPGTNTLAASADGVGGSPITLTAFGRIGSYVVTSSAASAAAGSTVTFTAQLTDAAGNAVARSGETVTWSLSGTSGTFSSATSQTNAAGIATVAFTLDTLLTAATTTIAASDAVSRTGTVQFAVTAGAPTKLAIVALPVEAGYLVTMSPVRVAISDRYGNTVPTSTGLISLSLGTNPGGATLEGTKTATSVNGVATFNQLTLDVAASGYRLAASSPGLTPVTSSPFDVSAVGVVTWIARPVSSLTISGGRVYFFSPPLVARYEQFEYLLSVPTTGGSTAAHFTPWGASPTLPTVLITSGAHVYGSYGGFPPATVRKIAAPGDSAAFLASSACINPAPPHYRPTEMPVEVKDDDTYLFLLTDGYLVFECVTRIRKSDGAKLRLLDRRPTTIAAAGGYLYFSDTASSGYAIKRMSVDGGPATGVVSGVGSTAKRMLVIGGTLYWSEGQTIRSAPTTGGPASTRASGLTNVTRLITDGTSLYVIDAGTIRRFRLSTFEGTTMVSNDAASDIALDSESLYWAASARVKKIRK